MVYNNIKGFYCNSFVNRTKNFAYHIILKNFVV